MLFQYIRVLKSKNGTLTDLSIQNQNELVDVLCDLTVNQDLIYIGQRLPSNNLFFQSSVANDVTANMVIEYWDGSAWQDAVDILDATNGLFNSGVVQFSPDRHHRWTYVNDTSDTNAPSELSTVTIYNLYWLRIKFDATLKATTAVKRIVYSFTSSQQIDNYDTTINNYLTSFGPTKTDWNDEIITSSIAVVADLKRNRAIFDKGQILDLSDVSVATDWKTLIHIYRNLGGDYEKKYEAAIKEYEKAIDLKCPTLDQNLNAQVDMFETADNENRMVRS